MQTSQMSRLNLTADVFAGLPPADHEQIVNGSHPELRFLDVLEDVWGNGFADAEAGDVSYRGHAFRVHRWIVISDEYGNRHLSEYATEDLAEDAFARLAEEID